MGDYVGDITPTPKFKAIAPVGASRHMGEISLWWFLIFFVAPNFAKFPSPYSRADFYTV